MIFCSQGWQGCPIPPPHHMRIGNSRMKWGNGHGSWVMGHGSWVMKDDHTTATTPFYPRRPRDAMHSAVCKSDVSVRPSITRRYCIKTKRWFLHRRRAQTFQFLEICGSSRNSKGVTPSDGDLWEWSGYEVATLANFQPISRRISKLVQDRTKVTIEH